MQMSSRVPCQPPSFFFSDPRHLTPPWLQPAFLTCPRSASCLFPVGWGWRVGTEQVLVHTFLLAHLTSTWMPYHHSGQTCHHKARPAALSETPSAWPHVPVVNNATATQKCVRKESKSWNLPSTAAGKWFWYATSFRCPLGSNPHREAGDVGWHG